MVKTTLRIQDGLKRAAQRQAIEEDTTLQDIFSRALEDYLQRTTTQKKRKINFITHDFGEPIDNLRRDDYYPEIPSEYTS
jgi:hypothetical protein